MFLRSQLRIIGRRQRTENQELKQQLDELNNTSRRRQMVLNKFRSGQSQRSSASDQDVTSLVDELFLLNQSEAE
eukprot:2623956-Prymnesium_polylepis.1